MYEKLTQIKLRPTLTSFTLQSYIAVTIRMRSTILPTAAV